MRTYRVVHFMPELKSGVISIKGKAIEEQL